MKILFYKIGRNILDSFRGKNLVWHLVAIVTTYIIVISGFDWQYFQFWRGSRLYYILFSAAAVGGLLPILAPVALLIWSKIRKNLSLLNTSYALGQAAIIGAFVSSFYKMFTGRLHPSLIGMSNIDLSLIFQFGLFRGGIFWGWPSSHTTIAFAMAFALWALYSENKIVRTLAVIYALYIGLGVSMTIHWFSDFIAGAIIGTVIGLVVGKTFKTRLATS